MIEITAFFVCSKMKLYFKCLGAWKYHLQFSRLKQFDRITNIRFGDVKKLFFRSDVRPGKNHLQIYGTLSFLKISKTKAGWYVEV